MHSHSTRAIDIALDGNLQEYYRFLHIDTSKMIRGRN